MLSEDAQKGLEKRLAQIFSDITELLDIHTINMMAVEELYAHYKHPRTAILMGHARSVFLLAAANKDIVIRNFSATRVKKSLTGYGRASKQQMQLTVTQRLNLKEMPTPNDIADAMAIALCCINEHEHSIG